MRVLLSVVVLLHCAILGFTIPTKTAHEILTSAAQQQKLIGTRSYATARAQATAWPEQIPFSTFVRQKRQIISTSAGSSTVSPSMTGSAKLGQLVIANTKVSVLPPALCGFVSYDNGTGTALGFVGCNNKGLMTGDADSFLFDNLATCTTSGGRFFCSQSGTADDRALNGCNDIDFATSYLYSTSSFPSQTYDLSYSYNTYSYACTWNTYWSSSICSKSYDTYTYTLPTTVTAYSYSTATFQLTSQYLYSFRTSIYPVTNGYYSSGTYLYKTTTTTAVYTQSSVAPVNYDTLKLSCYPQSYQFCQTFTMENSLAAYACGSSGYAVSSAFLGSTLTVLGLADLEQAFMGSTITLTSITTGSTYTRYSFLDMYATRTLTAASSGVVDNSPSAYLAQIKSNPPSCVNNLNTSCTALYTTAKDCWSQAYPPGPQECFCDALIANTCPELCFSNRGDRRNWYNWAMGLCSTLNSTIGQNFTKNWPQFENRTKTYYEDLVPFSWTIEPIGNAIGNATLSTHCPSQAAKIASFAIINAVVGLSTLFLGRRTVVKKLTCGVLGNPGSAMWPLVSIFVVGINLLANFVNAIMIHNETGYVVPPIGTLVLFWMSRPRLAWLATGLGTVQKEKSMYISLAASALLTELVLQSIGAIFIGKTVVFAIHNGYYQKNALQYAPKKSEALMMFAGALLWIIAIGFFYIYVLWNYLGVGTVVTTASGAVWRGIKKAGGGVVKPVGRKLSKWKMSRIRKRHPLAQRNRDSQGNAWKADGKKHAMVRLDDVEERHRLKKEERENMNYVTGLERMGLNPSVLSRISSAFIFLLVPFVGQWLFWVGFVGLFADKYCPPNVWQMMSVWSVFSAIGVFVGAGQ